MQKKSFAIFAAAVSALLLSGKGAYSGPYPFGDEPYRLNWGYDPEIDSGCWKWNWQQHGWDNHCPVYLSPKVYLYPRSPRVVLRSKG